MSRPLTVCKYCGAAIRRLAPGDAETARADAAEAALREVVAAYRQDAPHEFHARKWTEPTARLLRGLGL